MRLRLLSALGPLVLFACSSGDATPPAVDAGDPTDFAVAPVSCALKCPQTGTCPEVTTPYVCPSLGDWKTVPHDVACPAWDGSYPTPTPTKCTASAPAGDAARYAGKDPSDPAAYFLPDGRRVRAAGTEWFFADPDLDGGYTSKLLAIPGTSLAVTVDTGDGMHVVRLVDLAKLGGATTPVLSRITFDESQALGSAAAFVAPDLVLVGGHGGVLAFTLDTTKQTLTQDDARTIALPSSMDDQGKTAPLYVSGMALSAASDRLIVTGLFDHRALVYDVTKAGYGKLLGAVDLGPGGTFACATDPNEPSGAHAWCSLWTKSAVVEIDLSDATQPKVSRTFMVDKTPTGLAALDARWLAVANDLGDTVSLIDRVGGGVTPVPADAMATNGHGADPTRVAWDPSAKRLYATLSGENAIAAWNVDTSATPPAVVPAGRIPTSWWPSDVAVLADGSLAIANARGHSNGPIDMQFAPAKGQSTAGTCGGVQRVPAPSASDLTSGDAEVRTNDAVSALAGAPQVTCPNGEDDFPLPPTNTQGPSKKIKHVVFVVRENKTFDALLGDLPTVNGDPSLTMKKSPADMDKLWLNFREAVRSFSTSDNYYTDAELSAQGHVWTFYGRTDEFTERTWEIDGYSRSIYTSPLPLEGFAPHSIPVEGSVVDWLGGHGVQCDTLGEGLAFNRKVTDHDPLDTHYPGGFIQQTYYSDVERACYMAGRFRVLCDLSPFVYETLPNDHTSGVSPSTASPETMIAINDEATGMVLDAVSHSPFWESTLVIVTEDDPSDGGDHVEHHRTPILFASPWIKRGYVSKTHIDVSSLHKIFAHVFGIPYPNSEVANAALPLDLFSSTPDYTPFTYQPRVWPTTCGVDSTLAERRLTESWDFDRVDEQPGLEAQVRRYLRGEQLDELPPELEADVARRTEAKRGRVVDDR